MRTAQAGVRFSSFINGLLLVLNFLAATQDLNLYRASRIDSSTHILVLYTSTGTQRKIDLSIMKMQAQLCCTCVKFMIEFLHSIHVSGEERCNKCVYLKFTKSAANTNRGTKSMETVDPPASFLAWPCVNIYLCATWDKAKLRLCMVLIFVRIKILRIVNFQIGV